MIQFTGKQIIFYIVAETAEDYYHLSNATYTHSEYSTYFSQLIQEAGNIYYTLGTTTNEGKMVVTITFNEEDKEAAYKLIAQLTERLSTLKPTT